MAMLHQLGAIPRQLSGRIVAECSGPQMLPRSAMYPSVGQALSQRAATIRGVPHQHKRTPPITNVSPARFASAIASRKAESGEESGDGDGGDAPLAPSVLTNIYNHRRAHYNREVSALRKQYAAEVATQREQDRLRKTREEAALRRATLERRHAKALRTVEGARRQLAKAEARRREWEEELAITQRERDAKKARYRAARQRIADQLEAECHLWLTTPEEVEKALGNPVASQRLWARPGGMIGAPSGPDTGFGDAGDFWRYECHTWDARPTYKAPRELMLEEIEEMSYLRANIDPKYWTRAHVEEFAEKDLLARLRAIVREEGRRSLLEKQREMMRDVYGGGDGAGQRESEGRRLPPTAMPAPPLDYLADYAAQEQEGVKILRRDPRRFFLFESDLPSEHNLGAARAAADAAGGDVAGLDGELDAPPPSGKEAPPSTTAAPSAAPWVCATPSSTAGPPRSPCAWAGTSPPMRAPRRRRSATSAESACSRPPRRPRWPRPRGRLIA